MEPDLNSLDLKELKALHAKVSKAIATFEDRRKKEALVQLEEMARDLGFSSLAELTGVQGVRKTRAASTVTYVNPANAADTWSGRGRKPRWFVEAIDAGMSAEELQA